MKKHYTKTMISEQKIEKLKKIIKEILEDEDKSKESQLLQPPQSLIRKLQSLLNTTNKIFDYALIFQNESTIGDHAGFDFIFVNDQDEVDYDSLEGFPICKVYANRVKQINNK